MPCRHVQFCFLEVEAEVEVISHVPLDVIKGLQGIAQSSNYEDVILDIRSLPHSKIAIRAIRAVCILDCIVALMGRWHGGSYRLAALIAQWLLWAWWLLYAWWLLWAETIACFRGSFGSSRDGQFSYYPFCLALPILARGDPEMRSQLQQLSSLLFSCGVFWTVCADEQAEIVEMEQAETNKPRTSRDEQAEI